MTSRAEVPSGSSCATVIRPEWANGGPGMDWTAVLAAAELGSGGMTNVSPLVAAGIGLAVFVVAMVAGSRLRERGSPRHDKTTSLR